MDIKKKIQFRLRLCLSSNYRFVRELCVFDAAYYLRQVQVPFTPDSDPLWEYLKIKGSDYPRNALADSLWLPVINPHPLFDTSFYLLRYFPDGLRTNPFVHYLKKGWKKNFQPGPFFDSDAYRAESNWREEDGNPLSHYTRQGALQCISPGLYFDVDWYLSKNPVLNEVKTGIVKHYKLYGAQDKKSPVPVFDPDYYLDQLSNSKDAEHDPLSHYVATADTNTHCPSEWFDPDYYCENCGSAVQRSSALAHYLAQGVFEKRYTDSRVDRLSEKPVISILVPVYNPDICFLNNCIRSVLYQAYPHWELCLVDDCSTNEGIRDLLEQWGMKDSRIKVQFLDRNHGISAATNSAASLAEGEYLGFLDHDDELTLDCLYYVAEAIGRTGAQVLYTDEDLTGDDGSRLSAFYKPDFNQELLLSHNYITHFVVVSNPLFNEIGGFNPQCDGAQDFDIILRLTEKTDKIQHIPKILYHWRAISSSTSINHEQKHYAHEAGKRALMGVAERRNIDAAVEDTGINYSYNFRYKPLNNQQVSIFIWSDSGNAQDIMKNCSALEVHGSVNSKIITVSNDQHGTRQYTQEESADWAPQRYVVSSSKNISKAEGLHQAIMKHDGEYLVFLDSSVTGAADDWLQHLLGPFAADDSGIVCGRVSYNGGDGPSYTIPDITDQSAAYFTTFLHSSTRHMNGLHCSQRVNYCGWDVCMIRRKLYDRLGGFDYETFPHTLAMTDLSLRAAGAGYKTLYIPGAQVNCHEQALDLFVFDSEELRLEKQRFQKKWRAKLCTIDPFYNPGILDENNIAREQFISWLSGQ